MKVVRLKAPGSVSNLQLREEDPPVPKPGDVLVRIRAISVNRLKLVIDPSFGLDAITAAFEYYQAQNHFGKITLEI